MTPVPDRAKAIEAMARELRAARFDPAELTPWEDQGEEVQEFYRRLAGAALAALEADDLYLIDMHETKTLKWVRDRMDLLAFTTPTEQSWESIYKKLRRELNVSSVPVEEENDE